MDDLARRRFLRDELTYEQGRVLLCPESGEHVVETVDGEVRARRALSCLVAPRVGDLVVLARSQRAVSYIVAVLEREDDAPIELTADRDLEVTSTTGAVTVRGREGVRLASANDVSVVSARVSVHTVDANVTTERLSFVGELLRTQIERVKVVARSLDIILERASQTVARSYRTVTEVDQLRAERVDYVAEKNFSLRGANALVTARELVKVDGEQIHVG